MPENSTRWSFTASVLSDIASGNEGAAISKQSACKFYIYTPIFRYAYLGGLSVLQFPASKIDTPTGFNQTRSTSVDLPHSQASNQMRRVMWPTFGQCALLQGPSMGAFDHWHIQSPGTVPMLAGVDTEWLESLYSYTSR